MNKPFSVRRTVVACVSLTALLVVGCVADTDELKPEATTSTVATEEAEPTESQATEAEATAEETASESPTETPTVDPATTSTAEPAPSSGPLDGAELSAEALEWFDTFCVSIASVGEVAGPSTEPDMDVAEVTDIVVQTYTDLGTILTTASTDLAALPDDFNFEGSAELTDHVESNLAAVGDVYVTGAETVSSAGYATEEELVAAINEIEAEAQGSSTPNFGLDSLDPTVIEAVGSQVTSCAGLDA
ncbi:hypothetical protein LKO27_10565 [Tessaracoccus sp. OS52]|uniref:hypothetical protein n=1 Tax=Tessaracoccus sp. OS52 TaxID=2886691 RepID=UPI001D10F494|nr:hypothetical protein [Tessaracoccus sp. OS52]MCC2593846.1 hypothetical protein [Tessaracoccus sp. OS52]